MNRSSSPAPHTPPRSRIRRLAPALALALTCVLLSPVCAWAADDAIVYPSAAEATIAPGRDFYLIGTADDAATRGVRVEVFQGTDTTAAPVRALVYDNAGAVSPTALSTARAESLPGIDTYVNKPGIAESALLMPDLAYDSTMVGSGSLAVNKISADSRNFAALILGGNSDHLGIAAGSALGAGTYTLRVTLGISTADAADDNTLTRTLTMATVSSKVMARFSPSNHMAAVDTLAAASGWRVYTDPFPGYWSPQNLKCIYYDGAAPYASSDVFLEAKARWRLADGMEYVSGDVQCFLYNISPTCATQNTEMGVLQANQRIDSSAVTYYYYALGEPSLTVRGATLTSKFKALVVGDKLEFTRSQASADTGDDNVFATYLDYDADVDVDVRDGLSVREGQEVSLFGIAAPIQNTRDEVAQVDDGAYAIARSISSVAYTFTKDGQVVYRETKPVGIARDFAEDWTGQQSLYEFKHDFATGATATLPAGNYTVNAAALDSNGREVAGGTETFALTVIGDVVPTPVPATDPASQPGSTASASLAKTGDATTLPLSVAAALTVTSLLVVARARNNRTERTPDPRR